MDGLCFRSERKQKLQVLNLKIGAMRKMLQNKITETTFIYLISAISEQIGYINENIY